VLIALFARTDFPLISERQQFAKLAPEAVLEFRAQAGVLVENVEKLADFFAELIELLPLRAD
jgi:hypothetical protein